MTTTTSTRPTRQARKPVARFLTPLGGSLYRLTVGSAWDNYSISPVPCDIGGVAFSVAALTVERESPLYHVHVSRPGIATCDCIAGSKGTRCKHRDGVLKLIALGRLVGPTLPMAADYQTDAA